MTLPLTFAPPKGLQTRWASPENPSGRPGAGGGANGGRKGAPNLPVPGGRSITLAEEGPGIAGTIRRIWLTLPERTPEILRGVRLDFYWDGADLPAVSVPLGDFFGIGLGRAVAYDCEYFAIAEGRGFCCTLPMPFRSGMRLVLTNETAHDIPMLFYDVNYTVGDRHTDDTLYLHAHFRRENPTTLQRDYAFLPRVEGRGRFLGVHFGVIASRAEYQRTWWGEGEVKFYLDGDSDLPTLCGTGAEDYVGSAWGLGVFSQRYQGCPLADSEKGAYAFYRYHAPDPIYFSRSIRGTIQQIGHAGGEALEALLASPTTIYHAGPGRAPLSAPKENSGGALFERQDDWSSVAYFYLDCKINQLPLLPPLAERLAGL